MAPFRSKRGDTFKGVDKFELMQGFVQFRSRSALLLCNYRAASEWGSVARCLVKHTRTDQKTRAKARQVKMLAGSDVTMSATSGRSVLR